ncbi:2TM domain-containing protein [Microcoleus sp. FACHB-68]|uniref:2TM domain-containing protein n=1 Tax=Microcoleus sp. FACHB-68 TaxID=2692826 RepID=UPI0016848D11|nr:2TM domain-containing protein [Microcoleus sp. FACHB-68]MBD1938577.1 2TM domain-containing protein [Microcoleus sp. FACHB-68]
MPPRWPRKPDRQDPAYRRLDDRMNFAIHVAAFGACNSSIWFFRNLQSSAWNWTPWLTGIWLTVLLGHALYVFAIADYSDSAPASLSKASSESGPPSS